MSLLSKPTSYPAAQLRLDNIFGSTIFKRPSTSAYNRFVSTQSPARFLPASLHNHMPTDHGFDPILSITRQLDRPIHNPLIH